MTGRSFLVTGVATAAVVVGGCGAAPAPRPGTTPAVTIAASERPPVASIAPAATASEAPAASVPPSAPASALPATASPSPAPSPDPDEAKRAEEEQRVRAEVAAAKATADAMTAQANAECPDLKPGELRHPGAVSRCARLHDEAARAVRRYELLKKEAQAAGIAVQ